MPPKSEMVLRLFVLFLILNCSYLREGVSQSIIGPFDDNKLKIFFVPFSINVPGWRESYHEYYETKTRKILRNVLLSLSRDSSLRFVWSETSFLSLFWRDADESTRSQLKRLVANGQLEIAGGGWVVNDEANTHYSGILQQLIEGHLWLHDHLDFKPKNGWALDAFGHSPTMSFLLKRMGLENLVIDRVANETVWSMAREKTLEFSWRQAWTDTDSGGDLFTLVLPFRYDLCYCVFSLNDDCARELSIAPSIIESGEGIEKKFDEFLKYSSYFHSNMLLVPVGSRFSFDDEDDVREIFDRFSGFINYTRRHFSGDVEVRFATLNEYFTSRFELYPRDHFRIASGDFFPYTDNNLDYWSGLYTSRPFYKRKDRILLSYLRAAEILYALAWSSKNNSLLGKWFISPDSGLFSLLVEARNIVSLFQHHQAITGTSSTRVVLEYARSFNVAFKLLQHIMQQAAYYLLYDHTRHDSYKPENTAVYFEVGQRHRKSLYEVSEKILLNIDKRIQRVVIFNSLTWNRKELVSILVNTHNIVVTNCNGTQVLSQTSPTFSTSGLMVPSVYSVSFVAEVEALTFKTYFLRVLYPNEEIKSNVHSSIDLFNSNPRIKTSAGFENINRHEESKKFSLSNHIMEAKFSKYGLLYSVSVRGKSRISTLTYIDFVIYKNKKSGAYVFDPILPEKYANVKHSVVSVIRGPLYSQADMFSQAFGDEFFRHSVRMYHIDCMISFGLMVRNFVNLPRGPKEIAMRISTNIGSGDEFFTDLNGFQMIERRYNPWLKLSANYYPMSAAAYIQDNRQRLTVVSGQPGGFTSPASGQMEMMLDRRITTDDQKGLGEGIRDNRPYIHTVTLIPEARIQNYDHVKANPASGSLSQTAIALSHSILNPLVKMFFVSGEETKLRAEYRGSPLRDWGNDLHLVKMHSFFRREKPLVGVILHRLDIDKSFLMRGKYSLSNGHIALDSLFPMNFNDTPVPASLSFLDLGKKFPPNYTDHIQTMDLKAYVMS